MPADVVASLAKLYEVTSDYLLELSDTDDFPRQKKNLPDVNFTKNKFKR